MESTPEFQQFISRIFPRLFERLNDPMALSQQQHLYHEVLETVLACFHFDSHTVDEKHRPLRGKRSQKSRFERAATSSKLAACVIIGIADQASQLQLCCSYRVLYEFDFLAAG